MLSLDARFTGTKISTRLAFAFSTLLALLIVLTAVGIYQVNQIDRGLTAINDINGAKQSFAVDMRGSVHDRAITLRDIVITAGNGNLDALRADIDRLQESYQNATTGMQGVIQQYSTTPQEQNLLNHIASQAEMVRALTLQVFDARDTGDYELAQTLMLEQAGPAYREWLNRINQFIDLQGQINNVSTAQARATASGFQMLMLGLTLFALVVGGVIAMFLSRQLLRELGAEPHDVKTFAEAVGRGELTTKGQLKKGDNRSIMASQVEMARQLQTIVTQVRASAEAVAANSEQIAEGNNDLSSRTEQQASALAETASAMEQLNSTVKLNAENSEQASQEAQSASQIATKGGEAVHQVVGTMNELNQSSQEIAGITSTIDSIAFQTNILALNASVEAARAGEHGRGFAVVAEEVRNLAQRSAEAAREINQLIASNLERVKHGNQRAEEASKSTEEIVAAIDRVTTIMQEISHASAEQSAGVQEVGQAVTEMDQVTQQNAALVGQSAKSAANLRENARQLLQMMEAFKLPQAVQGAQRASAHNMAPALASPKARPMATSPTQHQPEPEWESF
ncbi:methyl-accepting chemotaxis protein [Vreelandella nanhaiensis]|uniref:Methyl-accepting chemotaxis protein n=1 Tax=Vreelandella nanhaiensis TaxID=1258546 RepID=A0A3S0WMD2_9GAMM|nr:methyl-accepting chemotaxis protein [Halomonas nanhaiensis]RUR32996.1 methyl-accepting chemotaxis protein [Halomonas nanhaiensis]